MNLVTPQPPPIEQITRKIVEAFQPRRIVLFGSRARGEARPDSDVDLMVEMDTAERPVARTARVYEALWPSGCPLDLMVFTPEEVRQGRSSRYSLVSIIEAEGRVLYER